MEQSLSYLRHFTFRLHLDESRDYLRRTLVVSSRYSVPCDKSPDRIKCRCGTPPRICSSPVDILATRERPQEAEMDLTLKGHHHASTRQVATLFHHHVASSPQQNLDEPLDVTLNSGKNN